MVETMTSLNEDHTNTVLVVLDIVYGDAVPI